MCIGFSKVLNWARSFGLGRLSFDCVWFVGTTAFILGEDSAVSLVDVYYISGLRDCIRALAGHDVMIWDKKGLGG